MSYEEQINLTHLEALLPGDVVVALSEDQGGVRVSRKHPASNSIPSRSPEWGQPMPWRLRIVYSWRALAGRVRVAPATVDTSRLETEGFIQGTVRVQMTPGTKGWEHDYGD